MNNGRWPHRYGTEKSNTHCNKGSFFSALAKSSTMTYSASVDLIEQPTKSETSIDSLELVPTDEPAWIAEKRPDWGEKLVVAEWEDRDHFRAKNGWKGRDLVHDSNSPVSISEYFVDYSKCENSLPGFTRGGTGTVLTGIVTFTARAESHRGFCHGGSMTSVLDDVIGWVSFVTTGTCKPWSAFTCQINTNLKKPIMVDSTLIIRGTITNVDRRKVFVTAELIDPLDDSVHATGEGLSVLNRGVLPYLSRESMESLPGM